MLGLIGYDCVWLDMEHQDYDYDQAFNMCLAARASGMEPIWETSLPWKDGYCRLRRPDDVDNLLLLSQHIMKHSFSLSILKLELRFQISMITSISLI